MKKLLCIDFDDCLINWTYYNNYSSYYNQLGKIPDFLLELEGTNREEVFLNSIRTNFEIIKEIAGKYNFKIFITSSWSSLLNDDLSIKTNISNSFDEIEIKILDIIKEQIKDKVIGVDKYNDRIKMIKELSKNYDLIVVIDDFPLEKEFQNLKNVKFIRIINEIIYDNNKSKGNILKLEKIIKNILNNFEINNNNNIN